MLGQELQGAAKGCWSQPCQSRQGAEPVAGVPGARAGLCGVLLTCPHCPRSPPGPALLQSPLRLRARERRRAGLQGGRHHHPDQPDRRELVRGDDPRPVRLLPAQLRGSAGPATSVTAPSVPSSIPAPARPPRLPSGPGATREQTRRVPRPLPPVNLGFLVFFLCPSGA